MKIFQIHAGGMNASGMAVVAAPDIEFHTGGIDVTAKADIKNYWKVVETCPEYHNILM